MIPRCPVTYEALEGGSRYSAAGLRVIHPRLSDLIPLQLTAQELVREASRRAAKVSIQGVQPKLSLVIDVSRNAFDVVDTGGRYILKPPNPSFPSLPENEDLTMKLARTAGIEVPHHGMVYAKDDSLSYFITRFDRRDRPPFRVPVEDFAQLSGRSRDTKYDFSIEQVIGVVNRHCTFPRVELSSLFRRVLFSFLVGNEDMHLKNYSLISRARIVRLSPAYDLLNSAIVLGADAVESALPLGGKRRGLSRRLLIDYLGAERCQLPAKEEYAALVEERAERLFR